MKFFGECESFVGVYDELSGWPFPIFVLTTTAEITRNYFGRKIDENWFKSGAYHENFQTESLTAKAVKITFHLT